MSARAAALVIVLGAVGVLGGFVYARRNEAGAEPQLYAGGGGDPFAWPEWETVDILGSTSMAETESFSTGESAGVFDDYILPVAYAAGAVFNFGRRMDLSIAGLDAIKRHEAFVATPYLDAAGKWTIGYGHLIKAGESFDSLSESAALSLLSRDVNAAENAVNSLVRATLTQPQFDALVSFVFNVGAGAFRSSTLLKKINSGDATAAAEFGRWVYVTKSGQKLVANGLVSRRQSEAQLFASAGMGVMV